MKIFIAGRMPGILSVPLTIAVGIPKLCFAIKANPSAKKYEY